MKKEKSKSKLKREKSKSKMKKEKEKKKKDKKKKEKRRLSKKKSSEIALANNEIIEMKKDVKEGNLVLDLDNIASNDSVVEPGAAKKGSNIQEPGASESNSLESDSDNTQKQMDL